MCSEMQTQLLKVHLQTASAHHCAAPADNFEQCHTAVLEREAITWVSKLQVAQQPLADLKVVLALLSAGALCHDCEYGR